MKTDKRDFYVYVLFDADAIPRYVGKGRGSRILASARKRTKENHLKNTFIERTMQTIGDIPAIKIRENLAEEHALEIEMALIAAIGRRRNRTGPLTNISAGGDGFTSKTAKQFAASLTPMERWLINQAISKAALRYSPQERSARAHKRQQDMGPEKRKALARKATATKLIIYTEEEQRQMATKASLAVTKTTWINNGIKNKRLDSGVAAPEGWVYGRLTPIESVNAVKVSTMNTRWINDGKQSLRIKKSEPLPDGWTYGRTKSSKASSKMAQNTTSPLSPIVISRP